ncbi:MAG: hydroxyacid dehydrogenase, partial [Parcubacteria group bacterium]|nr:hydroxyacid dehydrogenase [Parcubacteria group bacterium]
KNKQIAGAALDVLEEEGSIKDEQELLVQRELTNETLKTTLMNHIFIDLDNVIVSPHNAFNTEEALENILATTIENITSYLKGKPINMVK